MAPAAGWPTTWSAHYLGVRLTNGELMNTRAAKIIASISIAYGLMWVGIGLFYLNIQKIFSNPAALIQEYLTDEDMIVIAAFASVYVLIGLCNVLSGVFIFKKKKFAIKFLFTTVIITALLNSVNGIDINSMLFISYSLFVILLVISYQRSFAIYQDNQLMSDEVSLKVKKATKVFGSLVLISFTFIGITIYLLSNSDSEAVSVQSKVETLKWTVTLPDGRHYEGAARDNIPHGVGTLTWPDGKKYEGMFVDGKMEGAGKLTLPNGVSYEGSFSNNAAHGDGVCTFPDNDIKECKAENGKIIN